MSTINIDKPFVTPTELVSALFVLHDWSDNDAECRYDEWRLGDYIAISITNEYEYEGDNPDIIKQTVEVIIGSEYHSMPHIKTKEQLISLAKLLLDKDISFKDRFKSNA